MWRGLLSVEPAVYDVCRKDGFAAGRYSDLGLSDTAFAAVYFTRFDLESKNLIFHSDRLGGEIPDDVVVSEPVSPQDYFVYVRCNEEGSRELLSLDRYG